MIASEQGSVSATVCDIRLNSSWSRLIILWMKSNWAEDHDSNLWNENMADPGCLSRSTWYIRKTVVENLACVASVSVRFGSKKNREIKFDVTWSYVKRQTAKMKLLPSVFSSLNSRVKIFVFVTISRRHFSIFMWFNEGLEEKSTNSEVIFAVCRLT